MIARTPPEDALAMLLKPLPGPRPGRAKNDDGQEGIFGKREDHLRARSGARVVSETG